MKNSKPVAAYVLPFLDYCEVEKGLSDTTQRNYRQYLRAFTTWLERTGRQARSPHELTPKDVWAYRLYLARSHKTPAGKRLGKKSQNHYLIALRALLDYFAARDIDSLPSSKVALAKQGADQHISFLSMRDIEKLVAVPDPTLPSGLRDRAILELLFSTGMRIAELVALNADQVSFLNDGNRSRTYELSVLGKGKRIRTVFISPRCAEWLRAYLRTRRDVHKPLFINLTSRSGDHRLSPRAIQRMIARCALLAGLSKKVTPHTLRHSYATDLLARGADLRSVQELLGHKNVATTQVYTHVTNKRLRDIHQRFHSGQDTASP